MRYKLKVEITLHLIIIIVCSMGLLTMKTWPYEARLFPGAVTGVTLISALLSLFVYYKKQKDNDDETIKTQIQQSRSDKNMRVLISFAWLFVYALSIWLIGYINASVLYAFLYMKVKGKLNWIVSTMVTIGIFVILKGLFSY